MPSAPPPIFVPVCKTCLLWDEPLPPSITGICRLGGGMVKRGRHERCRKHQHRADMPTVQGDKACCNCGVLPGNPHWANCAIGAEEALELSGSEVKHDR